MIRRLLATVATVATCTVMTGCNFLELPEYEQSVAPTEELLADSESPTAGKSSPAAAITASAREAKEASLIVAKGENPEQRRQRELLKTGFDALPADGVGYYMDIQEARLRQEFANTDIMIKRDNNSITLVVPGAAMFNTNSTRLNPDVLSSLDSVARVLSEYSKTLVAVEGYTDNVGASDYNQRLSEQRALAVGNYLAGKGVGTERLVVVGYGERRPMAGNESEQGRAINRRVELTLYPLTLASN